MGAGLVEMSLKNPAAIRYKLSCARIVGRSHVASSTPCQDFVAARRTREMACVALADGAGSRAQSEIGAEVAVKATLRILCDRFDELYTLAISNRLDVATLIVDQCISALGKKAKAIDSTIDALASTLMFVAHKNGQFLAGHLGDGIIARAAADGEIETLSHPDNGEFANTTVFVTDAMARQRFRIYAGECASPAFAVMSDGTAESLYSRASKVPAAPALQKLFQWNTELPKTKVGEILMANLTQAFAKKSADDCSIGLLTLGRA